MKKNHRILLPLLLLGAALGAHAQESITGRVFGLSPAGEEPLPGANVYWAGTTTGSATGPDGRFALALPERWPAELVATYVGFRGDTLRITGPSAGPAIFRLQATVELRAVEVVERQSGTLMDSRSLINTEILNRKELARAACCDLSESFETNATVDVSFNDAISGTKTIRMLGLDGKYAQLSVENIPFIRGLSTASGLTLIPGTWINEINLSKGIGTAVNGPNAMTGQIDLCLLQPANEGPLFVNMYGNSQGRSELNVHTAQRTGANSDNLLLVHGNLFQTVMDQNGDGFMDMPLTKRINVMDRWMHRTERHNTQLMFRYVDDVREGGQATMGGAQEASGMPLYRIDIRNELFDVLGRHGFIFKNDPTRSIGLLFSGRRHDVSSLYGTRGYSGRQNSFYGNAVYQQLLGKGTDQVKTGLSFQYDDYAEAFRDSTYGRTEQMPGIFAEYTRHRGPFTLVAGMRADANSVFGNVASPRLHLKFDPGALTTIRVSAGHAFRTALPLVENASVLASSREVVVEGTLGMERAWNMGASFLHKFKWLDRKWAFGIDAYRTTFTEQVVTDLDRHPGSIVFYGLQGASFANSALADLQVELSRVWQLKTSYRFYDVRTTYDGELRARPFTPAHRGLIDLAYADRKERWRFDISLNLFGEGRIPDTGANPEEYRLPGRSPAYSTLHAQITLVQGPWEFYVGGENLTSTLQQRQIIAPDDPFGPYFDASMIWGPTNRAMIYGGFRFNIPRKTAEPTQP
jgi:outer membrane receptor for ferrienterochelin and colicins